MCWFNEPINDLNSEILFGFGKIFYCIWFPNHWFYSGVRDLEPHSSKSFWKIAHFSHLTAMFFAVQDASRDFFSIGLESKANLFSPSFLLVITIGFMKQSSSLLSNLTMCPSLSILYNSNFLVSSKSKWAILPFIWIALNGEWKCVILLSNCSFPNLFKKIIKNIVHVKSCIWMDKRLTRFRKRYGVH